MKTNDLNPFCNLEEVQSRGLYLIHFIIRALLCLVGFLAVGLWEGFKEWLEVVKERWG